MFESWADVFASSLVTNLLVSRELRIQDGVDLPSILIARYRIIWYAYTQHYLCIQCAHPICLYEYIFQNFMGVYYI